MNLEQYDLAICNAASVGIINKFSVSLNPWRHPDTYIAIATHTKDIYSYTITVICNNPFAAYNIVLKQHCDLLNLSQYNYIWYLYQQAVTISEWLNLVTECNIR